MGCCCSTSSDEWSDSDSDSDSSLSDFPPYIRRSTTTVELKQHTTAGTQHACLGAELKGDSGATCDEETLESHPREALDRLSTGGEENAPDWSNSFYSVRLIDADDLEQEQSQWATDEPGPSTVLLTSLFHTPPPETDTVFFQHLFLDQTLICCHHLLLDQTLFFSQHLLLDQTLFFSQHHLLLDQTLFFS
ncbi:hypothetical protein D4764_01G0008100 [Takifugu flavidus]|uniref:Uncharacterized protein n=1 Tax=Takifugu flavidus TaxID=433684 RepID=A0A5C6PNI9_9TELE|nr:hypothetical protein D4764_01G0008100 [Takifugu flavidus]